MTLLRKVHKEDEGDVKHKIAQLEKLGQTPIEP